jgi:hypothetical protein
VPTNTAFVTATNHRLPWLVTLFLVTGLLAACSGEEPVDPQRYVETDALVQLMNDNLSGTASLRKVADIDHARMGQEAGSPMPPARVLYFQMPAWKHNSSG